MKYLKLLMIIGLLGIFSCENLLDETSPNDIDSQGAINDGSSANAALVGLYSSLRNNSYYGGDFVMVSEAMGKNAEVGGFGDNESLQSLGRQEPAPDNGIINDMWLAVYNTITNANRLIEGLSVVDDISADEKNHIEAQALAIRAMAHFDLLRYFGEHWDTTSSYGIPISNAVSNSATILPRATVAAVYTFIIDELKSALAKIGDPDGIPYITASAIHGLLARVYLYNKTFDKAITEADIVIGGHTLVAKEDYASIFNSRQTSESVFEIVFDSQNTSSFNGYTYLKDVAARNELTYLASANLRAFVLDNTSDIRYQLLNYNASDNQGLTEDANNPGLTIRGRTHKYRGEQTRDNPAFVIRVAEMYLIKAEAQGITEGLVTLNNFRSQRGVDPVTATNDDEFVKVLLDERQAELNFEGHRYFDLARTGKTEAYGVVSSSYLRILPIPDREIKVSKGQVEQNPGY